MNVVDQATQTQLNNIQKKTGKSLDELAALARQSGLAKHGEMREMFKNTLGLGHGDANTLTHYVVQPDGTQPTEAADMPADRSLDEIYTGTKASLRPIHEKLMGEINRFGTFEIAPKKGYVSLRSKKQFAMIGPATQAQVEVGINAKDLDQGTRLIGQAAGGMCNYKVRLASIGEVDAELIAWLQAAYNGAG